ncbi:hypothetical protein OEZ85_006472 [Tetradesmus obliquus]|uniref:Secreted protein n=1 Tax=Tetradesmus obliquus TaxID=3088 RepID=A0ABY8TX53_TETOB|nr:hypothetical protein OEZ85_006472 [Tetradesmus obliquus]
MSAPPLVLLVLVHQALLAAAAVPRLFVQLPTDEVAAAAAPVLPEDVEVVTTASAGGRAAPNVMTAMINQELLLQVNTLVQLDLPGLSRAIRVKWQPTAVTATAHSRMAAAPATAARVGEVQGLPGPLSCVGMVTGGAHTQGSIW